MGNIASDSNFYNHDSDLINYADFVYKHMDLSEATLEKIIQDNQIDTFYNAFENEIGFEKCISGVKLSTIFEDFDTTQSNEVADENSKRNFIKELSEYYCAGLSNPDFFVQDIKETSKIFLDLTLFLTKTPYIQIISLDRPCLF